MDGPFNALSIAAFMSMYDFDILVCNELDLFTLQIIDEIELVPDNSNNVTEVDKENNG